jgi:hypothetical protein
LNRKKGRKGKGRLEAPGGVDERRELQYVRLIIIFSQTMKKAYKWRRLDIPKG